MFAHVCQVKIELLATDLAPTTGKSTVTHWHNKVWFVSFRVMLWWAEEIRPLPCHFEVFLKGVLKLKDEFGKLVTVRGAR